MELEGQLAAAAAVSSRSSSNSSSSFHQYRKSRVMSSEIVEIVDLEDNNNSNNNNNINNNNDNSITFGSGMVNDVYVCVGRDDMDAVKWAVDHISSGSRLFLVHVFPPVRYISTPVGRLAKNQLSRDQLRFYTKEENNKRRNLLHKYIRLCDDAKVPVDTMLLESSETGKAIVELIPVLNITNLVMGAKIPPRSRRLIKRVGKTEFVKRNAPDYCDLTIVCQGKSTTVTSDVHRHQHQHHHHRHQEQPTSASRVRRIASSMVNPERKLFHCACFSGKFD